MLLACVRGAVAGDSASPAEKSLSSYGVVLDAVTRVEILYYPERILTRTNVTPERLEDQYQYRLEIRDFPGAVQRLPLLVALQKTSITVSGDMPDVRTAVLLYDGGGNRMASLYFARGGTRGAINADTGAITSGVYTWAKSMMKGFSD